MKPTHSSGYLLNAALLGFLIVVILMADPTLYPHFRLAAAILCAVAVLWGVVMLIRPRLPVLLGGPDTAVPVWARLTFLSGGFAGLLTYFLH